MLPLSDGLKARNFNVGRVQRQDYDAAAGAPA